METKKVLITGGSGFIGQSIAKIFLDRGQDVCVFDVKPPNSACGKFVKGDIFDVERLRGVMKEYDVIIHLVGVADAGVAQREPMNSFKLNVESLQNVLEACRAHGSKKLIFPSSAAVYGIPDILPIKENYPPSPTNVYSWHKYVCEQLVKSYNENYDLEYVILRLFNVYGRGNKGVINFFLSKALKGEIIESFGPYQYRDFVYAGDVAEAFYRSAIYGKANKKIINIGSGRGTQIKEILDVIHELVPDAKWVFKKEKFTMYDSIADITLAKILLDFNPHESREFMKEIVKQEIMPEM
jgi:UDP-glucose 4-epimerase